MAMIPETGNAQALVEVRNFDADGMPDKPTALSICVKDAQLSEAFLQTRLWNIRWLEADILYQSPPTLATWEGTNIPMANISKFTVAVHVNALKGQATEGLFYDDPPFLLRPLPNTSQNTTRAITAVQGYQLKLMKLEKEVKLGFFQALLFGTTIFKWGWREKTEVRRKYLRKREPESIEIVPGQEEQIDTAESDEVEVEEREVVVCYPWFENVDIRHVFVDPGCRTPDIRDAKFVIHRIDMTFRDLLELKNDPFAEYDLPGEDVIKSWFEEPRETGDIGASGGNQAESYSRNTMYLHHAEPRFTKTTADPLDEPLEVLERVDNDKIITVLARRLVIRLEKNPFGKINYYSLNWWSNPDAFWGNGLGRYLGGEQRVQQGLTNGLLDITTLVLHPTYLRATGANVSTQQIRQRIGGIINVEVDRNKGINSVHDAFALLQQPTLPGEVFAEIQQSEARAEASSGANELLTQGAMPAKGRTSMGRTATGASAMSAAIATRLGSFVEDFVDQVFQPWLWQMYELNQERLPLSVLRRMLNEELGSAFSKAGQDGESAVWSKDIEKEVLGGLEPQFFNAGIESFDVLAGSHLSAKQQMAQALGLMMQLFTNPQNMQELAAVNDDYIDFRELMHMIHDMSGWRNYYSIVKKMTPEMKQHRDQNSPAAVMQAKTQGAQAQQQQSFQQKQALLDQENLAKASREVMRKIFEKGVEPEALTGQPAATVGFGAQESA